MACTFIRQTARYRWETSRDFGPDPWPKGPQMYYHVYVVTIEGISLGNSIYLTLIKVTINKNYSLTALNISQFTTAHAPVLSVCCIFTSLLVTASNGWCCHTSGSPKCLRVSEIEILDWPIYQFSTKATTTVLHKSKAKLKLYFDWRSVGQSLLVSCTHLWPVTNITYFSFNLV
jgi:hypothetical protein